MIVTRGLGRGGPQVLVAAGLGRRQLEVEPPPPPPPPSPGGGGGGIPSWRYPLPGRLIDAQRQRLIDEDELLLYMAASLIGAGLLH